MFKYEAHISRIATELTVLLGWNKLFIAAHMVLLFFSIFFSEYRHIPTHTPPSKYVRGWRDKPVRWHSWDTKPDWPMGHSMTSNVMLHNKNGEEEKAKSYFPKCLLHGE